MKTKMVLLVSLMLITFILFGWLPSVQGAMAANPKPIVVVATQEPPPPVETGANAPLVCGAIIILLIIVGGVAWNARLRKSKPEDH